MGPRFESVKVHQWPVGQVVKTAASHAVNIGSNPVRVTSSKLPKGTNPRLAARLLSRGGNFSLSPIESASLGFDGSPGKVLDKGSQIQYNTVCSPVKPDNIKLVRPHFRSQTSEAFGEEDEERRSERALAARPKRRIRSPRRVSWC